MKHIVAGLAVALLFAGAAHAQSAPVQPAAPQASQTENGSTDQAAPAANGQQVPTVPVQSPKKNNTTLIIGAVGAAALLGAASHSGGSDSTPVPVAVPQAPPAPPSSP